jgi:hypothetical protein
VIAIRSRPVALALLAAWTALVLDLCLSDHVPRVPRYPWAPWVWNLGHAPLFGGWAALLAVSLRPGRCPGPAPGERREHRAWLAAALAGVAFGTFVEWRQAHIPGRTASGLDVLTDAIGAFGVPWALATGALLTRRALAVLGVASLAALAATWW